MPKYDYRCPLCNADYTQVRGIMEEETPVKCTNCKIECIRVYSSPTISFKGNGFYTTDKKARLED